MINAISTADIAFIMSSSASAWLLSPVSIKHGLRTTDYGLRTGYKTGTTLNGLGMKYGLRYKTRTEHYGLSIKHEERFYIE